MADDAPDLIDLVGRRRVTQNADPVRSYRHVPICQLWRALLGGPCRCAEYGATPNERGITVGTRARAEQARLEGVTAGALDVGDSLFHAPDCEASEGTPPVGHIDGSGAMSPSVMEQVAHPEKLTGDEVISPAHIDGSDNG